MLGMRGKVALQPAIGEALGAACIVCMRIISAMQMQVMVLHLGAVFSASVVHPIVQWVFSMLDSIIKVSSTCLM